VAVLVIDMLNTYRHADAEVLAPTVADIVDPLAGLISRARERDDVELIYVNDNSGDFTTGFDDLVEAALHGERPDLVTPIAPAEGCLRLLTVRHSAFYASSLDYLLSRLEPQRLILTGQVTEQCILYTALDAYVRHFREEHACRARPGGEVPGLRLAMASCWPAVCPHASHRTRRFSLRHAS
jgi:nicotinamidase-related amidase